ncbi:MAG TPA: hypothetical protein VN203_10025, partial [Candidatus Acidoferrum sp.]|nr:hypothetical protein [Candidatus Acidoferrum sp.]
MNGTKADLTNITRLMWNKPWTICYLLLLLAVQGSCGLQGVHWTDSVGVSEVLPRPRDLVPYPVDGQIAGVNPP